MQPIPSLEPRDVARARLASQYLTSPWPKRASDLVRALGAVQAQDYAGAKWALAQRMNGLTDAEIEREISSGAIVRTHVLRPTWHFVAAADIRWLLALTAPRVRATMAYYDRQLEITPAVARKSNDVLANALSGGKHLTRTELGKVLARARVGPTAGQRLGHLMARAELDAVVCSGARRGKQFTYALLDERVPPTAPIERDEALLELTRRYFTMRGPATPHDFSWWSGLTIADVKRGIQIAGAELTRMVVDDTDNWALAAFEPPPRANKAGPTAHLLPNYDEYFIGFKNRRAIGHRLGDLSSVTGGNALIGHVIVVDGQLVGGWSRTIEKGHVAVALNVITRLTTAERRAVERAARAFSAFLGTQLQLSG